MKRIVPLLAGVFLLMALFGTPAAAAAEVPPLPHAFYGAVEIDGSPAPVGTEVEARGEGVIPNTSGNPITVTETGYYGGDLKLVVQGYIEDGATLTFFVDGVAANETEEWHSGEVTLLDLTAAAAPEPEPTVAGPTYYYIRTNLFGIEKSYRIERDGELLRTIEATSGDGNLTITIPEGTVALDKDGERLETLEGTTNETPPDPPEDAYIIELTYEFTPDGATFDPAITLVWSYGPDLPEDVAEEDLVVAYYDEDAGNWVEVDSVVDTENNTITASVAHFTTFAIIGSVPEEEVVVEEEPVGEQEEEEPVGEQEEEEEEPVGEQEEEEEEPVGEQEEEEEEPVGEQEEEEEVPTKPGFNWALYGGIIGGVVVVAGLLYYFLVFRRRYG